MTYINVGGGVVNLHDEKTTRQKYRNFAYIIGCENEYDILVASIDAALAKCGNVKERREIGELGVIEIGKLFDHHGYAIVNGKLVLIQK
jgi:hypothetical protein